MINIIEEKAKQMVYRCTRCGYCRLMFRARDETERVCPLMDTTSGFELYTARGRNWIARQILEGKLSIEKMTQEAISAIYACFICGSCTEHCLVLDPRSWERFPNNVYDDHLIINDEITRYLRSLIIDVGRPPSEVREVLRNYQHFSNPYGKSKEERGAWAKKLDFKVKNIVEEGGTTLLYTGSIAPYEERAEKALLAIAKTLKLANVNFGILGPQETDSGAEAYDLGELGLFEDLAKKNLEAFKKYNISKIITISPHDYNVFKRYYPMILGEDWSKLNIEVQHYTQAIAEAIKDKRITMKNKLSNMKVTYHDPCYLGRKNGIYDDPRMIISATGANLIEMKLSRHNSYCCGGGGGGKWYRPPERTRAEIERIKQAAGTGANAILVACPICLTMLEDGARSTGIDIKVMEVAEFLMTGV
ncbi:MAG: (Fe-S)-binding protein [Candidatus Bathyarchaeia archaeon]